MSEVVFQCWQEDFSKVKSCKIKQTTHFSLFRNPPKVILMQNNKTLKLSPYVIFGRAVHGENTENG